MSITKLGVIRNYRLSFTCPVEPNGNEPPAICAKARLMLRQLHGMIRASETLCLSMEAEHGNSDSLARVPGSDPK